MQKIRVMPRESFKPKPTDESKLGFGRIFTDYMFVMDYNPEQGWYKPRVAPYESLSLDPATMVLHYGQSIFEGLKCYRRADGGLQLFRAKDNFERMNRSAERLAIPPFDVEMALTGLKKLLEVEQDWVPKSEGTSLYIRPTLIATDPFVGVRPSNTYMFYIILSPVGAYYANGLAPVGIYVEDEYVRAVRGGLGFAKASANYAASLKAGVIAAEKGFDQVLWLDGVEQKYVEEVGSMNMMFVIDNKLVTPELNGSILPGITRDSVLKLAAKNGMEVEERKISISEVFDRIRDGSLQEAFGTGTAAVVSPVGVLCEGETKVEIGGGKIGKVTQMMYDQLTGIQYGRIEDEFGWMTKLS